MIFLTSPCWGRAVSFAFKPFNPPLPPLKRGENLIKLPLSKGDLGGSESSGKVRKYALGKALKTEIS